jgi:N-acetylglucosaminyl-diphospho-decaprenol L-rhamnosyltransferase
VPDAPNQAPSDPLVPSRPSPPSDALPESVTRADLPGEKRPDVSVIVVNYRSAELTLKALAEARRGADALTIQEIVVDGASGDQEVQLLRASLPTATVVALPENRGFAAGNNAGMEQATGRHLLLLNPDAFAQTDAVATLVEHLDEAPETGLVAPLLLNCDGSPQDNVFRRFPNLLTLFVDFCAPLAFLLRGTCLDPHNVPRAQLREPRPIAHAIGAALLVRAEAARDAGPLDESFFLYLEETEWQQRIADAGWRREVVPAARFTHLGGGSSSSHPLASPHYLKSVRRYYRHPRLAMVVTGVAGTISWLSLRLANSLGLGTERTRALERTFGELLTLLRHTLGR